MGNNYGKVRRARRPRAKGILRLVEMDREDDDNVAFLRAEWERMAGESLSLADVVSAALAAAAETVAEGISYGLVGGK